MNDKKMQCSECGKFISWRDIDSGEAVYRMIYPDSDLTTETWEGLCPKHYKKEQDEITHLHIQSGPGRNP